MNADRPIYKLYVCKPSEAYYLLGGSERESKNARILDALERTGGKKVIRCTARWATERWTGFGVEIFPNIAAVQAHARLLIEENWQRYVRSWSVLGEQDQEDTSDPRKESGEQVYKLFVYRYNEAYYRLQQDERVDKHARIREALRAQAVQAERIISCNAYWATERWTGFGVEVFPNIAAVQAHADLLSELCWQGYYVESWSVLGQRGSTRPAADQQVR